MIGGIFIGLLISFLIFASIIAAGIGNKPVDFVKKPDLDAELSNAQAIRQLQEIKPYFAYKGKTWTALDMAIAAIMANEKGEEKEIDV